MLAALRVGFHRCPQRACSLCQETGRARSSMGLQAETFLGTVAHSSEAARSGTSPTMLQSRRVVIHDASGNSLGWMFDVNSGYSGTYGPTSDSGQARASIATVTRHGRPFDLKLPITDASYFAGAPLGEGVNLSSAPPAT